MCNMTDLERGHAARAVVVARAVRLPQQPLVQALHAAVARVAQVALRRGALRRLAAPGLDRAHTLCRLLGPRLLLLRRGPFKALSGTFLPLLLLDMARQAGMSGNDSWHQPRPSPPKATTQQLH